MFVFFVVVREKKAKKTITAKESFPTLPILGSSLALETSVLALKLSMVAELRFGAASFSFPALHSKHAAPSDQEP